MREPLPTEKELREILERAGKATGGRWILANTKGCGGVAAHPRGAPSKRICYSPSYAMMREEMIFIAHSREDVPFLAKALLDVRHAAKIMEGNALTALGEAETQQDRDRIWYCKGIATGMEQARRVLGLPKYEQKEAKNDSRP